jgi:uncharacterized damage-inducible protein DinB
MTYYGSKEIAAAFRTVRGNTLIIAEEIPEDQYGFSPAPGVRTVAQTLTHIALLNRLPEMVHGANRVHTMAGFNFPAIFGEFMAEEAKPRTKAEIIELLKSSGDAFVSFVEGLSEEVLAERVEMPGQTPSSKTRFEMLLGPKEHEMHHRGQLMVSQRLLGLTPHLTRATMERVAAMQAAAKS